MTARVLLALALLASVAAAQEQVLVRRLSDSAAVRDGRTQTERVLYYFDPTATLVQGDEIEQGSSGHTELLLDGLGHVAIYSTAHVKLVSLSPGGDVLTVSDHDGGDAGHGILNRGGALYLASSVDGGFAPVPGVGVDGSTAMRTRYEPGQTSAGRFSIALG